MYENGSTAAETVTQELPVGDSYSVDSPVIEGYAVDMETVSGVMPGADVIVVVTYRAEEIFDDPSVPLGPPESEETSSSAVSSETSSADSSAAVEEEMPDDSVPLANPKTGDIGTSMAVFAAILSVGAAAAAILRKKKKDENND